MSIFVRLWLAMATVLLAGAWLMVDVLQEEVKPSVRQALEETLADNANLAAVLVADDLKAGRVGTPEFDARMQALLQRRLHRPQQVAFAAARRAPEIARHWRTGLRRVAQPELQMLQRGGVGPWKEIGQRGATRQRDVQRDLFHVVCFSAGPPQGRLAPLGGQSGGSAANLGVHVCSRTCRLKRPASSRASSSDCVAGSWMAAATTSGCTGSSRPPRSTSTTSFTLAGRP